MPNQCHKKIKQYLIWFCTVCWCFIKLSKAIWVKGIFKLCFRFLKMVKKKSKLSLHRRKRKEVIVSPFKKYETELATNGCSPFKSPWHKHKRIIKSPGKAPTFSPYKSPLTAVRYSPKQSLMRNKNRNTSAKSLYQSQDSWLHESVRWDFKPWPSLHMTQAVWGTFKTNITTITLILMGKR